MSSQPRTADVLVTRALSEPEILKKIQDDPRTELPILAKIVTKEYPPCSPLAWDQWIYRLVVIFLGFTVISSVIGAIILAARGITTTPEILVAIGSAAVGAMAGLLAPSPVQK